MSESTVDIVTLTARLHGLQTPKRGCGCGRIYEEVQVHTPCGQHDPTPLLADLLDAIERRFRETEDAHGEALVNLFRRTGALGDRQ